MNSYDTVSEAINSLNRLGYTIDFNLRSASACGLCQITGGCLSPNDFEIDEVHRFEGITDPGDETILYAISSTPLKLKGLLISAYGAYAAPEALSIIQKLIQRKATV